MFNVSVKLFYFLTINYVFPYFNYVFAEIIFSLSVFFGMNYKHFNLEAEVLFFN
jgi:hypothetical protein